MYPTFHAKEYSILELAHLCASVRFLLAQVCVCVQRAVARAMALARLPDMTQGVEEENVSSVMMTLTLAIKSGPVTCVKAPTHAC